MAQSNNHQDRDYLRRLDRSFYCGQAYVHWSMTMADRRKGWLSPGHHAAFREICFHALARHRLCCPVYCLMPDHGHLLLIGLNASSDQLGAIKWLRREWNHLLRPVKLQRQAYDNVLRESDRERDAFADLVGYILRNPVRKELVDQWSAWPYSGTCFPGYPKLNPRQVYFWENFWKAVLEQSR
jgi:REP element-mobilizing transposase RayT